MLICQSEEIQLNEGKKITKVNPRFIFICNNEQKRIRLTKLF